MIVYVSSSVPTLSSSMLKRSINIRQAFKWSAVILIWTAVTYGCLLIQRQTLHLSSILSAFSSMQVSQDIRIFTKSTNSMPVQHVYYLKTHKTGSTTIYSILAEYCRSHDLYPLLPSQIHINIQPPFSPRQVQIDPSFSIHDMVFNHHIYDPDIFKYLHNDTFRFTTLREPFTHFVSSFNYFRDTENFRYLKNINSSNPLKTFLDDRIMYEAKDYGSFTNNRQSMDLGYNLTHSFHDHAYIKAFIADTQTRFDLVLITDYFHESLILLKRTLHWSTEDIVYYRKLTSKNKFNASNELLEVYRKQHENFSLADIELYKHFLPVFKARIAREFGLGGEVKEFETVLAKVYSFCDKTRALDTQLEIAVGRWSNHIVMSYSRCKWLKLDEVSFTRHLKNIRKLKLLKYPP